MYSKVGLRSLQLTAGIALLIVLVALVVAAGYKRANTVKSVSTGITYQLMMSRAAFDKSVDLVTSIAVEEGLAMQPRMNHAGAQYANWASVGASFSIVGPSLSIHLEQHASESLIDAYSAAYLTVYVLDGGRDIRWQKLARRVELAMTSLAPSVQIKSASVGLDPAAYGKCFSPDRPKLADSICQYAVAVPVDFGELNKRISRSGDR